ncbi:Multidrug resistance-associated protein 1 [Amphibalanus amphitrite]|uniref:ABC-type glutathione-S-conjugate transporter n=1 Tax=Amphibalanus amphitrite TaxID=1232801 RepID=A0A6A4WY26_AMPAM|nr:Multidrug resistance-associated protein 1 [Amphibalanus amphitrite]
MSGLGGYCHSEFWNTSLTWDADVPDFTPCFERTVLVWVPCGFLWLFSPVETLMVLRSNDRFIPWTVLNICKYLFASVLLILQLGGLIYAVTQHSSDPDSIRSVDIYTPVILFVSIALALVFMLFEKRRGIRTSGVIWVFWTLLAFCGIAEFRTRIMNATGDERVDQDTTPFVLYMIYFPVLFAEWLLNCFADAPAQYVEDEIKGDKPSPKASSSFISNITFAWFEPMAFRGWRRSLQRDDLWDLNPADRCSKIVPVFNSHWYKLLEKSRSRAPPRVQKVEFTKTTDDVAFSGQKRAYKRASILPALIKTFGGSFLLGVLLKFINDTLQFINPQILSKIISFVSDPSQPSWHGYFYAVLMVCVNMLMSAVLNQYFLVMMTLGMRVRTTLIAAVYRKALVISNLARRESTVGEIVNLMAVDAQRFMDLASYICLLWSAPYQIILAVYFLYQELGPSVFAGLAVMILLMPVNGFIANATKKLQLQQMKYKDQRVKLMNEILSGIKVLKLYAWEPSFEEQVLGIRQQEIRVLRKTAYLNAGTSFIWTCAPFVVTLITFAVYVLTGDDVDPHYLTPDKAFVSLSLFNLLRMPLSFLPMLIVFTVQVCLASFATYVLVDSDNVLDSRRAFVALALFNALRFPLSMLPMITISAVQANVSLTRMNKYLNSDDLDDQAVSHDTTESDPVVVENGTFTWDPESTPYLQDINMRVKEGSLVAVVGTVGSGKSSLLSALLGEMEKVGGRVNTKGNVAYVAQEAWIQNATLKDNILFGRTLDEDLYNRCVDACALRSDFDMLPGGDKTEIGEKGINLSGGQKQRVALARAVYSNSDIYFLDDPLSAVDSHVGKHIFENVIGPEGMLSKKTRILVTHGITYLPYTDTITVLKEGRVSETGPYKQLMDNKGAFSEFLLQYLTEAGEDEDVEELDEIKHQLEETMGRQELQRQMSRVKRESECPSEDGSIPELKSDEVTELLGSRHSITSVHTIQVKSSRLVQLAVYGYYMKSVGVFLTMLTFMLYVAAQACSVGSNIWLSNWTEDVEHFNDTHTRNVYLGVYGALGFGQAVFSVMAAFSLYTCLLIGAQIMHSDLMHNVIRLPMSFFDTTPLGRTINRFSKDVDVLDNTMPMVIRGFIMTFVVVTLFVLFPSIVMAYGMMRASQLLHSHILSRLFHNPLSFFDTTPLGRIVNRFSKDVDMMDNTLPFNIRSWINCLFSVLGTFFAIIYATPIFLAVVIPLLGVYYFMQLVYVSTSRQLKRLESVSRSPIYSHFSETITGSMTIRAYGKVQDFMLQSEAKVDDNQACYYPSMIANRWLSFRLDMIGTCITFFASLFAVLARDSIDVGLVGMSVSYAMQVTQTLNWLVRMTSDVETNIVAVERIKEYSETPQEAVWVDESRPRPPPEWPQSGRVQFNNYQTRYRPGLELVLKGIDADIAGGEKIGIVGRTGAGKSSLTLALFRIIEAAAGDITLDGIRISDIGLHDLRSKITIIPQDPVLFSGTLRQNLDPFDQYSDDQVWAALEHSHLKTFVKGLAAGLQHEISEGGGNLSVGQRQLICLGRALLRKTKILVLDEATAAVDLETDDLIQATIRSEFADCTVLTIAHRLNTIMDSTRVMVLDAGRIKEMAPPSQLLADKSSAFYSMAKDAGLV